jgi:hypothetical protein
VSALVMDRELNELSRAERLRWGEHTGERVVVTLTGRLLSVGSKALRVEFQAWDGAAPAVELDPNSIKEIALA